MDHHGVWQRGVNRWEPAALVSYPEGGKKCLLNTDTCLPDYTVSHQKAAIFIRLSDLTRCRKFTSIVHIVYNGWTVQLRLLWFWLTDAEEHPGNPSGPTAPSSAI